MEGREKGDRREKGKGKREGKRGQEKGGTGKRGHNE
jgi:hypothetical protein